MKKYYQLEQKIIHLFKKEKEIIYKNESYEVDCVDKPRPNNNKGECKSDVYIRLKNHLKTHEFKLSVKMESNHEWQESKLTKERAQSIFGDEYASIISSATKSIEHCFQSTPLIYKDQKGNTEAGSVTMGWRLEITNKPRKLSVPLTLDRKTIIESFYKGTNMEEEKKDAKVCGNVVNDSGVANYILITSEEESESYHDVLDNMIPLDEFNPPPLYLSFIANNYRRLKDKIDGSRSLAVYVDWFMENQQLHHQIVFDEPLIHKGKQLSNAFKQMLKENQTDFNQIKLSNDSICYNKNNLKDNFVPL